MSEDRGLFSKYQVRDVDGEPLDSGTFVLRPFNADGSVRDVAAQRALLVYAESCSEDLAEQIEAWIDEPATSDATTTLNISGNPG